MIRNSICISVVLVLILSGCTSSQPDLVGQVEMTPTPIGTIEPSESPLIPPATATPKSSAKVTPKPTATAKASARRVTVASLPSTFRSDETRDVSTVDTIVIHSLYNPTASDPFSIQSAKAVLDSSEVSSHFVIDRDGNVWQLVPENYQAWHAGESTMPAPDNRSKVNTFSIGVELIGNETSGFTSEQYNSVAKLVADLMDRLPVTKIVGHSDIAPGRKTDPWKFEWKTFETQVKANTSKSFSILGSHS